MDALDFDEYVRSLKWGSQYDEVWNRAEKKLLEKEKIKAEKKAAKEREKEAKKAARKAEREAKKREAKVAK